MGIDKSKNRLTTAFEPHRQAEDRLCARTAEPHPLRTMEATLRLVHEREVHRIELDPQNEHDNPEVIERERAGELIRANVRLMQEIEERTRVEAALRESEVRYRSLFEGAAEGIAIAEVETKRFLHANPTFCRMLGYSHEEITAMGVDNIHPVESLEYVLGEFHAQACGSKVLAVDIPCLRRDGTILYADISTSPILVDGKICNVGFFTDVTERKQTERQIEKLRFIKERLIGALSLNEKLTLITDGIVEIFGADFARIWLIREGDSCEKDCIHAASKDACKDRSHCLHLEASSGRYTHIDGNHRRVPFGCYKIGRVASGEDSRFITNDVARDPRVHDHEWALALGLVSFAGFRLLSSEGAPIGVMALFSRQAINPVEDGLLADLANYSSQVILSDRAREALLESETKFRALFENANDAIFIMKGDVFVDCNIRTLQMFHCSREQIIGQPPYRFSPPLQPDGRDSKEKALEKIHAALAGNRQSFEWKHCLHDGTAFDAEVSLNTVKLGSDLFIQAIVRDITRRKQLEEELHTLSMVDELTGLYNRRGFLMLSEQQLKLAERKKHCIVLHFIDLDHMKSINDTFGHLEGDAALVEIAAILRQTFRKSDIIGRMGGDEFAVLAIIAPHERQKTCARLRAALDSHNTSETRRYKLSLSVGAAYFDPENPSSLDELIAGADNLMYEEKRTKRELKMVELKEKILELEKASH